MAQPAYQLDWNLVRTFTAVVSTGSLTAASAALSLTYPTVARHIATLEESLQITLFDRTSTGMTPTAAGSRLAATAKDMRAQALAFETVTESLRSDPGGTVRITLSDFLTPIAPALLQPLRQDIFDSHATLEMVPSATLINLIQHDADIAVRHIRPTQADLICRRVGSVGISLWAEPAYLANHRDLNNAAPDSTSTDLPTLTYIDGISHAGLQRGAERLGFPVADEQITYKSDCVWTQLHAARRGWGVVALPDYLGRQYADLERLETPSKIPDLELWLVARRDMREKPLHRQTFNTLASSIEATFGENSETSDNAVPQKVSGAAPGESLAAAKTAATTQSAANA